MAVETVNPHTGRIEYRYEFFEPAKIERVLDASRRAFPEWAGLPLERRAELLRRAARELRSRREILQRLMTAEVGKLRREALAEIDKSADVCDHYADRAADYLGEQFIATEASRSYVRYVPIGAVFAIMPWNFPVWQVFRFLAPTLVAGNVAVLKHAVNVPRTADAIKDALDAAGLPPGVFDVLHVDNDQAAEVIRDERIAAVTLTGSERAGRAIAGNAGAALKKSVLELGGSDAFVVLADADMEAAVAAAVRSRYSNAGQTCIAAKRFIVVDAVADAFVRLLVEAASGLRLGDPEDDATTLAPLARRDLRDELHRQVRESVAAGALRVLGGEPDASHAGYPATILDRVAPGSPAYAEELFGPVAAILRVADEAEAVRVANDTAFGLGGSVWTRAAAAGERIARQLEAGAVFVNAIVRSDARLPFGGTKRSGYGRELADHGVREFTNVQTVYVV